LRKVIFDSSFLMSVSEHPTGWREDLTQALGLFEPVLLECVKAELAGLAEGAGKKARLARLALLLAEGFSPQPCGGARVDDELVSAALGSGAAVATVDEKLAESLRAVHVEVVSLRSGRAFLR
jgi:rRNA-processing protein FCF1